MAGRLRQGVGAPAATGWRLLRSLAGWLSRKTEIRKASTPLLLLQPLLKLGTSLMTWPHLEVCTSCTCSSFFPA